MPTNFDVDMHLYNSMLLSSEKQLLLNIGGRGQASEWASWT